MSQQDKPREWALHGMTKIYRDMEIGEDTHCEYTERIIGPQVGDTVIHVIEKSAYDKLEAALKEAVEALKKYDGMCVCLEDGDNFVANEALERIRKVMG